MKKFLTILTVAFLSVGMANGVVAQKKSKEEKRKEKRERKSWKKRAKKYAKKPFSLRDDLETTNKKLKELSDQNKELQRKYSSRLATIDSLQAIIGQNDSKIAALRTKYEKLQKAYEAQKNINEKGIIPGLVYKVQIGAFVHFNINEYLKDMDKNFEGETADGMNKYMMGNFREFTMADNFKKDIQKMGIKDAWVVPYIDGTRVTMEEAEEYLAKQGGPKPRAGSKP